MQAFLKQARLRAFSGTRRTHQHYYFCHKESGTPPAQARSLDQLAAEQQNDITAVLIDVPLEMLEKRMTGRRSCPICNEIYNIYFKPPRTDNVCDLHPEATLIQRADDNSETVRARLATYDEQTRPLVEYYKAAGLLHTIDGTREPEEIYEDIVRVLPQLHADSHR
jgi:adenylate kinase